MLGWHIFLILQLYCGGLNPQFWKWSPNERWTLCIPQCSLFLFLPVHPSSTAQVGLFREGSIRTKQYGKANFFTLPFPIFHLFLIVNITRVIFTIRKRWKIGKGRVKKLALPYCLVLIEPSLKSPTCAVEDGWTGRKRNKLHWGMHNVHLSFGDHFQNCGFNPPQYSWSIRKICHPSMKGWETNSFLCHPKSKDSCLDGEKGTFEISGVISVSLFNKRKSKWEL